jgi:hypothetical protein
LSDKLGPVGGRFDQLDGRENMKEFPLGIFRDKEE